MSKTSSAVKNRYNKKTYTVLRIMEKKAQAEQYKAICNAQGIPYSQPLHAAIERHIAENKDILESCCAKNEEEAEEEAEQSASIFSVKP